MADTRINGPLAYLNGELVPQAEVRIGALDSGLLLGDGVRELIRAARGRPLFLQRHLERLYAGARALDIDIGMRPEALAGAIDLTVAANGAERSALVLVVVTRGPIDRLWPVPPAGTGSVHFILVETDPPAPVLSRLVSLATVHLRAPTADLSPTMINTLGRPVYNAAVIQARRSGADDAILMEPGGFVSSCATANLFLVRHGAIFTSRGGHCLNGITRAQVIELADSHDIALFETDLVPGELAIADEAFATSTALGIVAVSRIDGRPMKAAPGPVTRRIAGLYQGLIDRTAARRPEAITLTSLDEAT